MFIVAIISERIEDDTLYIFKCVMAAGIVSTLILFSFFTEFRFMELVNNALAVVVIIILLAFVAMAFIMGPDIQGRAHLTKVDFR